MTFDSLVNDTVKLSEPQQAKMLFYMLGKMDGFYRYDFEKEKTLSKQQTLQLVAESIVAVK